LSQTAADLARNYRGPIVLQYGYRPFFLVAGLWAVLAMALWLAMLHGALLLPSAADPLTWHVHEMLFGFVVAAVSGFLLTAIPNWTQRLPVRGGPLALLVGLWAAGRLAMAFSTLTGPAIAAFVDLAFLAVFAATVLREILAGRNWRNLPMVVALLLLFLANFLMHLEFLGAAPTAAGGLRLGVAVMVLLITLIGGRIIPSFTRNWLAKREAAALPAPFGLADKLVMAITAPALLAWVLAPSWTGTGILLLLAGIASGARLARWRGLATGPEPLVWVLHLGYAWIPIGLVLLGLALLGIGLPQTAALHALTAGAMGTMTLAVMTRAALGHSGRPLTAGRATTAIYLLITLTAILRVVSPLAEAAYTALLGLAGLSWIAAFGLFVVAYWPVLTGPRQG